MLTEYDRQIAYSVGLRFATTDLTQRGSGPGDIIRFQFPPKITSDNRSANWSEGELIGSEPVAVIATSSAREITLNWTYIVEDYDTEGLSSGGGAIDSDIWSIAKIKQQINLLRGYFSRMRALDSSIDNLIVYFRYPWLTGDVAWSCRIRSVNVKHGETLVGKLGGLFPLRSDITVDLRLWTRGAYEKTPTSGVVQDINSLSFEPSPKDLWY